MNPVQQRSVYDRLLAQIPFAKLAAGTGKDEAALRSSAAKMVAEMIADHPRIVASSGEGWHLINHRSGPGSWRLQVMYPLAFASEMVFDIAKIEEAAALGLIGDDGQTVIPPPVCPECHSPTPLKRFQKEVGDWSRETFKLQTPASKIEHLRREVEELGKDPADAGEMADCLILLCGIAELAGVDLLAAAQAKMVVNRAREWGAPDETGVCSHVEE